MPQPTIVGNLPGPKNQAVGIRSPLECFFAVFDKYRL